MIPGITFSELWPITSSMNFCSLNTTWPYAAIRSSTDLKEFYKTKILQYCFLMKNNIILYPILNPAIQQILKMHKKEQGGIGVIVSQDWGLQNPSLQEKIWNTEKKGKLKMGNGNRKGWVDLKYYPCGGSIIFKTDLFSCSTLITKPQGCTKIIILSYSLWQWTNPLAEGRSEFLFIPTVK